MEKHEGSIGEDGDQVPSDGSSTQASIPVGSEFVEYVVRAGFNEPGNWLEAKVQVAFRSDGSQCTCKLIGYRAKNNGKGNGKLYLSFNSRNSWVHQRGDCVQDGQWHAINDQGSIYSENRRFNLLLRCTYYVNGAGDKPFSDVINEYAFSPIRPIIDPTKNFTDSSFKVTGTKGVQAYSLRVYKSYEMSTSFASIAANGKWWADIQIPSGVNQLSLTAEHLYGQWGSGKSDNRYLYRAALTSPAAGTVVPLKNLVFGGIAAPNTSVKVVLGGVGTPLSASANTGAGSSWQASVLANLTLGSGNLSVTAEIDGAQNYTNHYTIQILGYPVITNTQLTVPLGFTLTGRNRLPGATLTAYIGPSNTQVGTAGAATTDTFSITTNNLDPGAHALTVEQFHSGKGSGRSAAVTFNVKPEPPVVTSTITGELVKVHGTGFRGGQVHFHQPGNANTPLFSVDIKSDGTFEYDVPQSQLPGALHYSCRQSVTGVGTARIYSDGWVQLRTNVPTPVPTQLSSSRNGHKLTFSGRGQNWGTSQVVVVIYNNGADMRPGVPAGTVTNQAWSIVSVADFAPGNYNQLTAKMLVNNEYSQSAPVPAVIIPSPPPSLTPITAPTDQRPRISGTMWSGSKVEVQINGGPAKTATTTGASFYLDATSDWAPATYTVSVTAEFGGQKSTPSTQSLTVRAPQPKIITTGPVPLQAIITGEGWPGCRVRIFTTIGNQELGADNVKSDGKFEIALLKQAAGDQTLFAVQYQSDNPANASVESARVAVKFGVPTADITVPPEGGPTPRVSTFSGTTTARSGTVELWIGGAPLRTNIAITNGIWSAPGINLATGPKAVNVYIRDDGDLSAATIRNVKVVPEKLKIDSPLTNQYIGHQLWISGVGAFPGDQVIVRRLQTSLDFPPVTVDSRGYWTTSVRHDMTASSRVVAIARAGAGLDSETSDQIIPKLLHKAPQITQPQAGDRVGTKPVFSGLARPEATVTIAQWFNNTNVLATAKARADGYWEAQSTVALAEGGGWVLVRDTLNGQPSEWRRSERFEVRAMTAAPAPSSIQYP
ncbi:hypothetical protein QS468_10760 [Bacillus subtilis]|nr:hypothetical protein [Pseudomonas sp. A29(2023)]MDL5593185.1 hypothetical protein [Bacillus subtilis]